MQGPGGSNGPHNDRLVQAQTHHRGVAAQPILLGDDSGGLPEIGQHVVVGMGHHQDHSGAKLELHILHRAADAEDLLDVLIPYPGAADEAAAHQMDLDHIGGPGDAGGHAGGDHGDLPIVDEAGGLGHGHRALDHLVGALDVGHDEGPDPPGEGELPLHRLVHNAGDDGGLRPEPADEPGGGPAFGDGDDGRGVGVGGGGAGGVGGGPADAQADVRGHVPHPAKVVDVRLSPAGNGRHGLHRLHWVPAGGGLPGEHDGGGAVIDSVGHVGDLRPGGPGVGDHAVHS